MRTLSALRFVKAKSFRESVPLWPQQVAMQNNITNIDFLDDTNITFAIEYLATMRCLFENLNYDLIESIGHSFNNMFVSCEYLGQPCNPNDFFLQPTADFFNCYTFRPLKSSVGTCVGNGLSLTVFWRLINCHRKHTLSLKINIQWITFMVLKCKFMRLEPYLTLSYLV